MRLCLILMLSVFLWPGVTNEHAKRLQDQVRTATVHVVAVDGFGRDLGEATIDSFRDEDGGEFANRLRQNTGRQIPYNTYNLRVHKTAYHTTERKVYVFKPDVWIVVGLEVSIEGSQFPSPSWVVSGTVRNFDRAEQPIYVRLVGLYIDYVVEDRLVVSGESGSFTLAGVNPQGKFLLLTIGRSRILDIRLIEIPTKAPITSDLSSTDAGYLH